MSNYLQNRHARQNYGLYNPFFDDFFKEDNSFSTMMKTDIKENNDHYEMKIELPEVKKEDVKLSLDDGYLTVNAVFKNDSDEKEGKFIRRERSYGSFSRSYFVGDNIKEDENSALKWIPIEKLKEEVNEKWMLEHIYQKLVDKLFSLTKKAKRSSIIS